MPKKQTQAGLALTTILVFAAVAIIIITLGVSLMVIQAGSSRQFTSATDALTMAETGMENALIRLLRDPNYSGETLTLAKGTATINVDDTGINKVITVAGESADSIRTIQVVLDEEAGSFAVQSWQEL